MARGIAPTPRPDRQRSIPRGFGWIDHRLRRDGHLGAMSAEDMALYLFLVLAADHRGVSWWRLETIDRELGYPGWDAIATARCRLADLDLISFKPSGPHKPNGVYQVLDLAELRPRRADGR
jgi:hypothetical protein